MKVTNQWRISLPRTLFAVTIVLALLITGRTHAGNEPIHLVTDWSHRHVVFSAPKTLMQQFELSGNTRYVQQWLRRNSDKQDRESWRWARAQEGRDTLRGDWSINMGSGATVGAGNFPAKFSFDATTASCSDFVVYNTSLAGATAQATIVAFENLYVGTGGLCGTGPGPSTYWAYNTGTGDEAVTSPTLSVDGKQVAFIQSTSGGKGNLVLLRWKASSGTLSVPVAPTTETAAAYYNSGTGCTSPCMTTITFATGAANGSWTDGDLDTHSSPFYDYTPGSDTLYVGDNSGYVHKFHPVFNGAPAEVTTTWPVLAGEAPLSSPVYDPATGYVWTTTSWQTSNDSGARLHALCATTTCGTVGTTTPSGILGPTASGSNCGGTGASGDGQNLLLDAPILDPTNNTIYAFVGNDGNGNSAVYQFSSGYALHTCGVKVTLGTGTTANPAVPIYSGNFDNLYYGGSAGHMYVCGNAGGNPTLYQVVTPTTGIFTAGAATAGPVLTTAGATCSPVTENDSGSVDYVFVSVTANAVTGTPINCGTPAGGCVMSFNVTTGTGFSSSKTSTAHALETGGTSGIVVDGSSTAAGASQVYFTPLSNQSCTTSATTGGCAIQASQSALN